MSFVDTHRLLLGRVDLLLEQARVYADLGDLKAAKRCRDEARPHVRASGYGLVRDSVGGEH